MSTWQRFADGNVTWLDIQGATADDVGKLAQEFAAFAQVDRDDILKVGQRSRLEAREGYLFLLLLFPVYNRATRAIEPSEVDFFVTDRVLVTTHDGRLTPLTQSLAAVAHPETRQRLLTRSPSGLLIALLERLLDYCNPMLDHLSLDLHAIDAAIFQTTNRRTVREILIARRNITDVRRIMQGHKNTLKKLADVVAKRNDADARAHGLALGALISRTKDLWDHLEGFKESIVDLHATNESLLSNRLNEIIQHYTSISVIIFSMTLVATTFGLGARATPLVHWPGAYWLIAGLLVLVALGMLEYFRKRKWL